MAATANVHWLTAFRQHLKAGSLSTLYVFDVARCHQNYMLSDSPLMIRFSGPTKIYVLTEAVSPTPEERFRFRSTILYMTLPKPAHNFQSQAVSSHDKLEGFKVIPELLPQLALVLRLKYRTLCLQEKDVICRRLSVKGSS
ncbi:hypothetical protein Bca4012_012233 [Brassica carinata]